MSVTLQYYLLTFEGVLFLFVQYNGEPPNFILRILLYVEEINTPV